MAPSTDYDKFVNTLSTYRATLGQLRSDIANLPRNARNILSVDHAQLTDTYGGMSRQLNELRTHLQTTPSRFSLGEHYIRFMKIRSLIKQLNESVKDLGPSIARLQEGVRFSQQLELQQNLIRVREQDRRVREELGLDPDDKTVIFGNMPFRQLSFVPQIPGLGPGNTPGNAAWRNASTPNIMSLDRFRGFDDAPELPTSLPPPPNRSLGMGRSRSQDPRTFAASVANLEHDFGNMDMGHLDGSEQRLPPQQILAPRTDPNAPFPSSRGMGHRHALSFGTFNNRHNTAQPPQNSDNSSVGSANPPSIARRHSSSSGYSSRSYSTSLYPNSSSSGHGAGNQASPAGSMYANSVSGRSSLSIARSVSQYPPTSIQSGHQYHPAHDHDGGSFGVDGAQGASVGNTRVQGGRQPESGARGMDSGHAQPLSLRRVAAASQLQAGSSSNSNLPLLSGYLIPGRQRSGNENIVWDSSGDFDDMYVPDS
ncbi:hypothetical protein FA13DRAFT_1749757, partial [Coprinellus micaceus]